MEQNAFQIIKIMDWAKIELSGMNLTSYKFKPRIPATQQSTEVERLCYRFFFSAEGSDQPHSIEWATENEM